MIFWFKKHIFGNEHTHINDFDICNLTFKILGICPGDKIPSPENPLWCSCPSDSIEVYKDKCVVCNGEVPNAEQTACVGMLL